MSRAAAAGATGGADRRQQPEGPRPDRAIGGVLEQVEQRLDGQVPRWPDEAFDRGEVESRRGELDPEPRRRGDVPPERVGRGGAVGGASRSSGDRLGHPARRSTQRVQRGVDPGPPQFGLERDLQHRLRLAIEPVRSSPVPLGRRRTMPSSTAVYSPGFGSSRSQSVMSCATFRRSIDSASARTAAGPLLGVMGELVEQRSSWCEMV